MIEKLLKDFLEKQKSEVQKSEVQNGKMKTIKFRGKDIETGKFIYGDLIHYCNKVYIDDVRVDPDSVSQLVGYDADGKEIYEGDVCISKYVIEEKAKLVSDFLNINGEDDSQHFSYYKLKGK